MREAVVHCSNPAPCRDTVTAPLTPLDAILRAAARVARGPAARWLSALAAGESAQGDGRSTDREQAKDGAA